jgi:glutaredoxin
MKLAGGVDVASKSVQENHHMSSTAAVYRMVMPGNTCPHGVEAKSLLEKSGYTVEDHHLTSRTEVDIFKAQHGVATTPLIFIDDEAVGGCDELKRWLASRAH